MKKLKIGDYVKDVKNLHYSGIILDILHHYKVKRLDQHSKFHHIDDIYVVILNTTNHKILVNQRKWETGVVNFHRLDECDFKLPDKIAMYKILKELPI